MSTVKYRVHEVAMDFNKSTNEIVKILTKYATTPKNHMHILSTEELDIIFEYLTINNQIEDISIVFAEGMKTKAKEENDTDDCLRQEQERQELRTINKEIDDFFSSPKFLKLEEGETIVQKKFKLYNDSDYIKTQVDEEGFKFKEFYKRISHHNDDVAREMLKNNPELKMKVEGYPLDEQQMICILKETSQKHLVLAGAGTGKTTTIIGKIKYLLKNELCKPEDILALSFTNAATDELKERIKEETEQEIDTWTFHKLGLKIIKSFVKHTQEKELRDCIDRINNEIHFGIDTQALYELVLGLTEAYARGKSPVAPEDLLGDTIRKVLDIKKKDEEYINKLTDYLVFYGVPAKSMFDFESEEDYKEYLKYKPYTLLENKNKQVRSCCERDIANFLYKNGVAYEYEKPYEHNELIEEYQFDTCSLVYGEYKPDFYLPDYGIYIEFFAIDENDEKDEVPNFFKGKNGKSATTIYKEGIEWKCEIHSKYKTKLVKCYRKEINDVFLDKLKSELVDEYKVELTPKKPEEIYKEPTDYERLENGFINLTHTIINLIKSNNYSYEKIREIIREKEKELSGNICKQCMDLLELTKPIYDRYQYELYEKEKKIDFNDMINLATLVVENSKYHIVKEEKKDPHCYKYVIVDEYQDISKARFSLLKAMRKAHVKLFCVGDDWQSIYRFAGSDISYILNFQEYWRAHEISRIERTYRFPKALADISSEFVMRNDKQCSKEIDAKISDNDFRIVELCGTNRYLIEGCLADKLGQLPQKSKVFLLGRYGEYDMKCIDSKKFTSTYDNKKEMTKVYFHQRKDLDIYFLTVHKSKGLEADYVFILNNTDDVMGFPSKIQNAPLLDLLLGFNDSFPFAEERRLFYVALTRAKKKVFLLTVEGNESEFVKQLREKYEYTDSYEIVNFRTIKECLEIWKVKDRGEIFRLLEPWDVNEHLRKKEYISGSIQKGWSPTERGEDIGIGEYISKSKNKENDDGRPNCYYTQEASEYLFKYLRKELLRNEIVISAFHKGVGIKKCIEYWKNKDSLFRNLDESVEFEGRKIMKANFLLEKEGFIESFENKNGKGWIPTRKGEDIGIFKPENDPSDHKPRCMFTQKAADDLFKILRKNYKAQIVIPWLGGVSTREKPGVKQQKKKYEK